MQPEVQKNFYRQQKELKSLSFSRSKRICFCAGEQCVYGFDLLQGAFLGVVGQHDTQVSCVEVAASGEALASSSWDTLVKVWA
uniref:G-protein beta subunit n=1 Tax=Trepomonas sp. PC1 TaxID=1076344 RepID=A0A146K7E9_9EUKA|eukprot:JAP92547.1 G-protein beta subunit [Trepomonas sp. PC1]